MSIAVVGGVAAAVASAALVVSLAARRWSAVSERAMEALHETNKVAAAERAQRFSHDELAGLPESVQRYLRHVIPNNHRIIRTARVWVKGTFNSKAGKQQSWAPFTSEQLFTAASPGFVWDARIRMLPGLSVLVRDQFAAGGGSMYGAVLGLVPVVRASPGPEINESALMRYLAEAVWFPTALLPSQGVRWREVGSRVAEATLRVGDVEASVLFTFNENDEVAEMSSPARYKAVGGRYERQAWGGRLRTYTPVNGILVPTEAEVEWRPASGAEPYYRGRVELIEYSFD
jgi:hypothetical protein